MNGFKACLNKEFKEGLRTKKFYITLFSAIGFAILGIVDVVIMSLLKDVLSAENLGELASLFENNYSASLNFYCSFMISYFLIIIVIFNSGNISNQIKKKQWILPINAGIKVSNLIASNIIMSILEVVFSIIVSSLIHLVLTVIVCKPENITVINLLVGYLALIISMSVATTLTITLNAVSKKRWVSVTIVLTLYIVIASIFDSIYVAGKPLSTYTPFAFYYMSMQSAFSLPSYTVWQWLFSILTTLLICGVMIVWAVSKNKVKAEKTLNFSFFKKKEHSKEQ